MYYTIQPKDTLGKIARQFGLPLSLLLAFNPQISNPNRIYAGQQLHIPNTEDAPGSLSPHEPITATKLLDRARQAIGKGIRYQLGQGGMDPDHHLPTHNRKCDCSGFVCWVLGLSRKTELPFYRRHGGWIYTDSMVADINSSTGIFEKLIRPEPGCIVVYGAGKRIGHVGIVSEVTQGRMEKVIHCSSGNDRRHKDAVWETEPEVFDRADTVWGRFSG